MPLVLLKVLTPKCILFPNASGNTTYGRTFGHPRKFQPLENPPPTGW